MFLVLARAGDAAATALAARLGRGGGRAHVLVPGDLSVAGWRHDPAHADAGQVVVGGVVMPAGRIRGVITRLGMVTDADLAATIHPADRAYAAAEIQAFLVSWLSGLSCPVLNRPTPWNLAGPAWLPEQWLACAHQLGIPVEWPSGRRATFRREGEEPGSGAAPGATTVNAVDVVGTRCFAGGEDVGTTPAGRLATRLAAGAGGLALLRVAVTPGPEPRLLGAATGAAVDMGAPAVADAIAGLVGAGGDDGSVTRRIAVGVALA